MQKKTILISLLVAVVLAGGVFILLQRGLFSSQALPTPTAPAVMSRPWIEVVQSRVFALGNGSSSSSQQLQTGDEVNPGDTIQTEEGARANLYLPDGSLIRINPGTQLILSKALFDAQSGNITFQAQLLIGRIWAHVLPFSNTNSVFEIRTTNTVATVKGTTFGVEYTPGRTLVAGSSHEVVVQPLDPVSGRVIENAQAIVTGDHFVEVDDQDIDQIKANPQSFVSQDMGIDILNDDWVQENRTADDQLAQDHKNLEVLGPEGDLARKKYLESLYEEFGGDIEKQRTGQGATEEGTPVATQINLSVQPVGIKVMTSHTFDTITEGDTIGFSASLLMDDGSSNDITRVVEWKVDGLMGSIDQSGLFVAKLDDSISESGEGSGSVFATYRDSKTGKTFVARSKTFTVQAKIEPGAAGTPGQGD